MKKLNLINICSKELDNKELQNIVGGEDVHCCCACAYQHQGGSSTCDNACANVAGGLSSPQCED